MTDINLNDNPNEVEETAPCHNLKDMLMDSVNQIASSLSVDDYKNNLPALEGRLDLAHTVREEIKNCIKSCMEKSMNSVFQEYNLQEKHSKLHKLKENPINRGNEFCLNLTPETIILKGLEDKKENLQKLVQGETDRSNQLMSELTLQREEFRKHHEKTLKEITET